MAALKKGLTQKTEQAAKEASKPEAARARTAPAWSDTEYAEAMAMLEDPGIDQETRAELSRGVNAFSSANPDLAASVAVPEAAHLADSGSSAEATKRTKKRMRAEGYDAITSPEQYREKKGALEGHLGEKQELARQTRNREVDAGETTMPEDMAQELGEDVRAYETENPELNQGRVLFGDDGRPMVAGDVTDNMAAIDQEADRAREEIGLYQIDPKLPSASGRTDLYADPEYLPPGADIATILGANYHHEPPLELAKAALRDRLGSEAEHLTERDEAYRRFADAYWQEARSRAEAEGRPLLRVAHMSDPRWKKSAVGGLEGMARQTAQRSGDVLGPLAAGAYGALDAMTFGTGGELAAGGLGKLTGQDMIRQSHDLEERHPVAHGAGVLAGAVNPYGATARVYGALAGKAPGALRSAAAGAATGAAESYVGDRAYNLSETPDRQRTGLGGRAAEAALWGAGGGLLGELIGSFAANRVKGLREEGDLGPTLARAEQGGVRTSANPFGDAARKPFSMRHAEREALKSGRQPVDKMVEDVADPIAAAAFREQLGIVGGIEAEKAATLGGKTKLGRQRKSLDPLARQVDDELARLFDDTGRQLPGSDSDRKALGQLASQTLEVKVVPAARATAAVRSFGGGGRVYGGGSKRQTLEKLQDLLDKAPELAEHVRRAQRDARDPAVAAKAKPRRGKPKVPDTVREAPPTSGDPYADVREKGQYWLDDIEHQLKVGAITDKTAAKWRDELSQWVEEEMLIRKMKEAGASPEDVYPMIVANENRYPFHSNWRQGGSADAPATYREPADTEPDLGDTILPPAPDRGTLRSPPFKAVRDKAPSVEVEEKPYDGVSVTDDGLHVVEDMPGFVYVVGPRKLTPQQLQDTIGRLSDKIKDDRSTDLWKRLRDAGLRTRDKFADPSAEPRVKGATKLQGLSAKNAEWDRRLGEMRKKNEAAGLPGEMAPRTELEGGPGLPKLEFNQDQAFRGRLSKSGSGAGRELSDDALLDFAKKANVEDDLRKLRAYGAAGEITNAGSLRAAVGLRSLPSFYTGDPGAAIGLRTDPAARALSRQRPRPESDPRLRAAVSDRVRDLLRRLTGKAPGPKTEVAAGGRARSTPLEDLRTGRSGPLSARRLGPAAAAGHHRREEVTIDKLPADERKLLLRLIALSEGAPSKRAAGE